MIGEKKTFTHTLLRRIVRLVRHVFYPIKDQYLLNLIKHRKTGLFIAHYLIEIPLLILDIVAVPELISFFQYVFKRNARLLDADELQIAFHIFNDSFDLSKARIDENSTFGTRGGKYAFVAFYYINSKGKLSLSILIHELVHILQFEQTGSPYAIRNMMAHLFPPTYDYGGLEKIVDILRTASTIYDLNYEQRADIISDYCLLLCGHAPEWGKANSANLDQYYQVVQLLITLPSDASIH